MTDSLKPFPDNRQENIGNLRKAQLVMLRILKDIDTLCQKNKLQYWLDGGTLLGAVRHKGFIPWDYDMDILMPREDYQKFLTIAEKELPEYLFVQTKETAPWKDLVGAPTCKIRDRNSKYYAIGSEEKTETANYPIGVFVDIVPVDKFRTKFPGRNIDYFIKWVYRSMCNYHKASIEAGGNWKSKIFNALSLLKPIVRPLFWIKQYEKFLPKKIRKNNRLTENYRLGYAFDVPWIRLWEPEEIYPLRRMKFEDAEFPVPNNWDSVLKQFYGDYMKPPDEETQKKYYNNNFKVVFE